MMYEAPTLNPTINKNKLNPESKITGKAGSVEKPKFDSDAINAMLLSENAVASLRKHAKDNLSDADLDRLFAKMREKNEITEAEEKRLKAKFTMVGEGRIQGAEREFDNYEDAIEGLFDRKN